MSKHVHEFVAEGRARIVDAPAIPAAPRHQVEVDRNFGIPTRYYAMMAALFFAFITIMGLGFAAPGMAIPMAICAVFIAAFFLVPGAWVRMRGNDSRPLDQGSFEREGIMTYTGRISARDATVQMLLLPVLIVFWAVAAVVIAALV